MSRLRTGVLVVAALIAAPSWAVESVSLKRGGQTIEVAGKVLVEAEDGGVLLMARDGVLWAVQPDEIVERKKDDAPFAYLDKDEIAERLLAEMPDGFRIHQTAHYVICYNTTPAYAQWCGALYERLYRGFFWFWENQGLKLNEPDWPLVALVFEDKDSYVEHASKEFGEAAKLTFGYYSMRTNRVNMYDLTGTESNVRNPNIKTAAHVNTILSRPGAQQTVATIVHEATHQLAFNSGLQDRSADIPMWVSEGIAMYFETPDLRNAQGWRTIGAVNRARLATFREYVTDRPADSLVTLMQDNKRFSDPRTAAQTYAESWALNYYLFRTRTRDYLAYLKLLMEKKPLVSDTPEDRLTQFKSVFGDDLEKLDADFRRSLLRLR